VLGLHQGEDDDQHEDRVEQPSAPGVPADSGMVASTIGTAPRSPAQDRNALPASRPGRGPPAAGRRRRRPAPRSPPTAAGPAAPARPDDQRRDQRAASRLGETSSPSSTNSPIWATQASPSANPRIGPAVRQPAVAEHHPGHVDGEETGGVRDAPAAYARNGEPDRGDRVEPGRRQRRVPQQPAPAAPTASPIAAPAASS
jgi:hypothetical protein